MFDHACASRTYTLDLGREPEGEQREKSKVEGVCKGLNDRGGDGDKGESNLRMVQADSWTKESKSCRDSPGGKVNLSELQEGNFGRCPRHQDHTSSRGELQEQTLRWAYHCSISKLLGCSRVIYPVASVWS